MKKKIEIFNIFSDHVKLLTEMNVEWNGELGAPAISSKRPYGNSNIAGDIIRILEWKEPTDELAEYEDLEAKAIQIHLQMETVLQILLLNPFGIKVGPYKKRDEYDNKSWVFIGVGYKG